MISCSLFVFPSILSSWASVSLFGSNGGDTIAREEEEKSRFTVLLVGLAETTINVVLTVAKKAEMEGLRRSKECINSAAWHESECMNPTASYVI